MIHRICMAFLVSGMLTSCALAAVPSQVNYQGYLTNGNGEPISGVVSLAFTIYSDAVGGPSVWSESQSNVNVTDGIFSVSLGSVNPIYDQVFADSALWLAVAVSGQPEMTPRKRILSVPFSYRVSTVDRSAGGEIRGWLSVDGETSSNYWGPFSLSGNATGNTNLSVQGVYGKATNLHDTPGGWAIGGHFEAVPGGSSTACGVFGSVNSFASTPAFGVYGSCRGDGPGTGGLFEGESWSGRSSSGVRGEAFVGNASDSLSWAIGVIGAATNESSGASIGGSFSAASEGTGQHVGVDSYVRANSNSDAIGVSSSSINEGDGTVLGVFSSAASYSSGDVYAGYFVSSHLGTGPQVGVFAGAPVSRGYAGYFHGDVFITDSLLVQGSIGTLIEKSNGEHVIANSITSPGVWVEDYGVSELINGRASIEFESDFLGCVAIGADNPPLVFVQPQGDCNGTYVIPDESGFEVYELKNGTSSISFSYRVVAKRKGCSDTRFSRVAKTTSLHETPFKAEVEVRDAGLGSANPFSKTRLAPPTSRLR